MSGDRSLYKSRYPAGLSDLLPLEIGRKKTAETPRALRHAKASDLLLKKGFSLKSVSRHIGHSSTAITAEMYIHDSIDFHEMFSKDLI